MLAAATATSKKVNSTKQKKNWKRKDGELKNIDLWQELDRLLALHKVTVFWVKGHADNAFNNRCDELAVIERDRSAAR